MHEGGHLVTSIHLWLRACICHYEISRAVISLLLGREYLIRNRLVLQSTPVEHVNLLRLCQKCSLRLLVYRDALLHHSLKYNKFTRLLE